MNNFIKLSKDEILTRLWKENPEFFNILNKSRAIEKTRDELFTFFNFLDRSLFNASKDSPYKKYHIVERENARQCLRIIKNTIREKKEQLANFATLPILIDLAKKPEKKVKEVSKGFLAEYYFLFRGLRCSTGLGYKIYIPKVKDENYVELERLDAYSEYMDSYFQKYQTGLDKHLIKRQKKMKNKILKYFNATEKDWKNYKWQFENIIKDADVLKSLVNLDDNELKSVQMANKHKIPFQITPYYLSLFNPDERDFSDRSVRAQVIPSLNYINNFIENSKNKEDMDFMGEKLTSPVELITRRYAKILIFKPYDTCPQICVYCQRNWEIKDMDESFTSIKKINKAVEWIKNNKYINEVLITGGDPLTLNDDLIDDILSKVSQINHIERIRIGSRTLASVPQRITDNLIKVFKKHYNLPELDIAFMTHFQHPTEITPDVIKAVKKIKNAGINIYNQQVFTYYNSFKFETSMLRKTLKMAGIDPYYSFNTKGKKETDDFRVPIARIEQERKEEARLLPGIVRTDEPVFNVPKLGKSHLRATFQNHEVIAILPDGKRVYRFLPWESKLGVIGYYIYKDVSIYDYIKRLYKDGENLKEYNSIWYYF
ncbi:MAG: KamA family radical SAM protein [Candidatus Muiribacteriota bacterium]